MDHLGVEVAATDEVDAATDAAQGAGPGDLRGERHLLLLRPAGQGVGHGPGKEPWEVYVVKADADDLAKAADGSDCCAGTSCGLRGLRIDLQELLTPGRG